MKRKLDELINSFYLNYDENNRLNKDKANNVEFITTTTYIDKYLTKDSRILEVGAGTGAYSLYYASKGYSVDAVELVESNLNILKSNIKPNYNINAIQGNALDLSCYKDNTFDITLVLGPLYHLFNEDEQVRAIKEAIRVTKKDGVIFIAFVLFDASMVKFGFVDGVINLEYGKDEHFNPDYTPNNKEEYIINHMYFKDVKKLMKSLNVNVITYVSTDGISKIIKNVVNEMDEETYKHFIKYHLTTCEREDLIGYSAHILSIIKK